MTAKGRGLLWHGSHATEFLSSALPLIHIQLRCIFFHFVGVVFFLKYQQSFMSFSGSAPILKFVAYQILP